MMPQSLARPCRTATFCLTVALAMLLRDSAAIGQSAPSNPPPTRRTVVDPPGTERRANGLWPAGTSITTILGGAADPVPTVGDAAPGESGGAALSPHPTVLSGTLASPRHEESFDVANERVDSEDGRWIQAPPPPRVFHAAAYDPGKRRMVMFGGTDGKERNDLWELSLKKHPKWKQLFARGEAPKPRGHAAMVYDPGRRRMLVYGGSDHPGESSAEIYGDVWELSLQGHPTWRQVIPAGEAPTPRRGASAIYDPVGDRMVIFGGLTGGGVWNDETWMLSLSGPSVWTRLIAPGTAPSPRWQHSAVYDPVRHRMVVFGGNGVAGFANNDSYALSLGDAAAWSEIAASGTFPPRVFKHSAIYDAPRDRMVIYGGEGVFSNFVELWTLSLGGAPTWSPIAPATHPTPRWSHVGVYDSSQDRLVIQGGSGLLADSWAMTLATPAWSRLDLPYGIPFSRTGHTAIYDPVRDRMIVYGTQYGVSDTEFHLYGGAWALSLSHGLEWRPIDAPGQPALTGNHPTFYDPIDDRMLVVRGRLNMGEVWQLSLGGAPSWTAIVPSGPVPVAAGWIAGAFDTRDRRFVAYGLGASKRETWALELEGGLHWVPLAAGNPPPSTPYAFASIYDPVRHRMILFTGQSGVANEVWELSLSGPAAWSRLTPLGTPPNGHYYNSVIYEPLRDRMIIHSGQNAFDRRDATWSLALDGPGEWKRLVPSGYEPRSRNEHSALYDPRRERMILFGGIGGGLAEDCWFLEFGGGTDESGDAEEGATEEEDLAAIPREWERSGAIGSPRTLLVRNEPNPFTGSTQIELVLPRSSPVVVIVRDAQGRQLRELARGDLPAGRSTLQWDGRDSAGRRLPAGLYFLYVAAGDERRVRRTLLVR